MRFRIGLVGTEDQIYVLVCVFLIHAVQLRCHHIIIIRFIADISMVCVVYVASYSMTDILAAEILALSLFAVVEVGKTTIHCPTHGCCMMFRCSQSDSHMSRSR